MGKLLALFAVVVSLVGFIPAVTGSDDWWWYALIRASYVIFVLAVVASLLSERRASEAVVGAQFLAAATALAFATVALVKLYETDSFGSNAYLWANEALLFAVAALAFGLTLARRRSTAGAVGLAMAIAMAVGCAIYAVTRKQSLDAELWWLIAAAGAFLAASAAAGLDRDGTVASKPSSAPLDG